MWRQLLFLVRNLAIYVLAVAVFGTWHHLNWTVLLAIPALGLLVLNAVWVAIVFGIFSARHRDLLPILTSATLTLFILTPVTWPTDLTQGPAGTAGRVRLLEWVPTFTIWRSFERLCSAKPRTPVTGSLSA